MSNRILRLLDDQRTAFVKLRKYKVGGLFMEPGAGKTLPAYELVCSVPNVDYVLWFTPFQTKENLRAEIEKYGGFAVPLDIVGTETLSSSNRTYLDLRDKLKKARCPFVVCDESLKIKNWEAIRTKRMIELGELAEYKLILNGTPLSRDIVDLWAQLQFLSPKILNMSLQEFKNTFCTFKTITKRIGIVKHTKEFVIGYDNVDYLYSLIRHYIFNCDLKLKVAQNYETYDYHIDDECRKAYTEIKEHFLKLDTLMFFNNNIFLRMVQRLQSAYCASENKLERLGEILDGTHSTIVFCKFIKSEEAVAAAFPKLRVLTYGKHSLGLNLQQYDRIIFFDKTWDYAQRLQTERRIYRTGQLNDCLYTDLTGDIGLEKMIEGNIRGKSSLLEYFKKVGVEQIMQEL